MSRTATAAALVLVGVLVRLGITMRSVYAMTGHFVGPSFRFQDDYVLGAPARTTRSWQPGDVFKETRIVQIPDPAPDGPYVLEVGVWNPETREHLRLDWRRRERQRLLRLAVSATAVRVEVE